MDSKRHCDFCNRSGVEIETLFGAKTKVCGDCISVFAKHLPSERSLSLPKALREASAFLVERGKTTLAGDCIMCADVIEEILTEDAHG